MCGADMALIRAEDDPWQGLVLAQQLLSPVFRRRSLRSALRAWRWASWQRSWRSTLATCSKPSSWRASWHMSIRSDFPIQHQAAWASGTLDLPALKCLIASFPVSNLA